MNIKTKQKESMKKIKDIWQKDRKTKRSKDKKQLELARKKQTFIKILNRLGARDRESERDKGGRERERETDRHPDRQIIE